MKALSLTAAVLPLLVPFTVLAEEKKRSTVDHFQWISFHSPSMPGYRTAEMLSSGFVGATVTLSSNSKRLNMNDLTFRASRDWLEVRHNPDKGRVILRMVRQPGADERATTLVLRNNKTGQTQTLAFYVNTWLTGTGSVDPNATMARAQCKSLGASLLTTQEFRTLSRQWFGLSSGYLQEMYPGATVFNERAQAGSSFWVHEAKALYLHTGAKSTDRGVNTVCKHDYSSPSQDLLS
ncbi:hypothetical protein ACLBW0_06160 [Enterobacteriaceae bacterium C34A]